MYRKLIDLRVVAHLKNVPMQKSVYMRINCIQKHACIEIILMLGEFFMVRIVMLIDLCSHLTLGPSDLKLMRNNMILYLSRKGGTNYEKYLNCTYQVPNLDKRMI